jgi:hypothetical protein
LAQHSLYEWFGVIAANTAGLEALALMPRGTLLVIAFVVVATAVVAELAMLASTKMTPTTIIVASSVRPVALVLIGKMVHPTRVLLLQLLAHLTPCFRLKLFELMALEASIILTSFVDQLEVLCKSL